MERVTIELHGVERVISIELYGMDRVSKELYGVDRVSIELYTGTQVKSGRTREETHR